MLANEISFGRRYLVRGPRRERTDAEPALLRLGLAAAARYPSDGQRVGTADPERQLHETVPR